MKSRYIALLVVLSVLTGSLHATIYHVDDDAPGDPLPFDPNVSDLGEDGSAEHPFDSIQEAIDAAVDGDTIVVAPGHYLSPDPWEYDEIHFQGKNIRLVGSAPTDFTVVEKTILCGVVIFKGTESSGCLLQGFKIQNHGHGGILGNYTHATISHCILSGNGPCGATVVKDVYGQIRNCLIVDNTTFHDCGMLPVVSGCVELVNCTIANNMSGISVFMLRNCPPIRNCIIYGNLGQITVNGGLLKQSTILADYSLIQNWTPDDKRLGIAGTDPCFVRFGQWLMDYGPGIVVERRGEETTPTRRSGPTTGSVLVEGDYHLKSEGWRWSPQEAHGSHWYFDASTSPAIDAGHPMYDLREELERVPDDPEGRWGCNHAIDLGAYGGTTQASLAPTAGEAPGVGTVDLRDYWPFHRDHQWLVFNPGGNPCRILVPVEPSSDYPIYPLVMSDAPRWVTGVRCFCVDRIFYMTDDSFIPIPPRVPQHVQAQYPQFPVVGSTIEAPYDPFLKGTSEYRSVLVMRGTLAEALAGTPVDPARLLDGSWPDVIALKEIGQDGTAGIPIAIFARGFGPLMIAGLPITGAMVNSEYLGEGWTRQR